MAEEIEVTGEEIEESQAEMPPIGGSTSSANIQVINYNGSKINPISLGVVPSASNPTG